MDWSGRVILVNPPLALGRSYHIAPPLGLLTVASGLEASGHRDITLLDLALEFIEGKLPHGQQLGQVAAERLAEFRGDLYGFSIQCVNLPIALDIAQRLHALRPESRIVFGGHHASLLGELLTGHFPFIHEVVSGPGESHLPPAIAGDQWLTPDYSKAPSWERYAASSPRPTGLIEVARGCPFSCSFCSIPLAFGHRVRWKPVASVIAEVSYLAARGCREIHFVDDTFTLNEDYVYELLDGLQGGGHELSWTAMTRVDLVSPLLLKSMAEAGCHSILYGVESADAQTLDGIHKQGKGYPELTEFIQWHSEAGINPTLYFLINLPQDTSVTLQHTLAVASRLSVLDPGSCHFQLPRFTPGTPLTQQVADALVLDRGTQYADTLYKTVGESAREVWGYIEQHPDLCSTYYTAPGPLSPHTANALSWVGDILFRCFPITMAALAEKNSLLALFDHLGSLRTGRDWEAFPHSKLAALLEEYVSAEARELSEAVRFERWLGDSLSGNNQGDYYLSQVDIAAVRQAVQDTTLSLRSALNCQQRLYQRSSV